MKEETGGVTYIHAGTHTKKEVESNTMHRSQHRTLSATAHKGDTMAPRWMKCSTPFSNKTNATNRQKPKRRK